LLLLILQPIADALGPAFVFAAMTNEDGAHEVDAKAASSKFTGAALAFLMRG
jgi:hypothetical protein